MKPAIVVQAFLIFAGLWNNYFIPALVLQSREKMILPILIATLCGADYTNFDISMRVYSTYASCS